MTLLAIIISALLIAFKLAGLTTISWGMCLLPLTIIVVMYLIAIFFVVVSFILEYIRVSKR